LWSFIPNGVRVVRFRVLLGTDDNYSLLSTDCGSSPASLWATLSVTLKVDGIVYFTKLVGKFTDPTAIPVDIDVSTNSSIVFTVVQAGSSNNCNHMMFANIRFDYCPVGMYGQYCQYPTCNNIKYDNSSVCNSRGNCTAYNTCACNDGYFGQFCQYWKCFDAQYNSTLACSSRGNCTSMNTCKCNTNYYGENCQTYTCGNYTNASPLVCNGPQNGKCSSYENCTCNTGYSGKYCDTWYCYSTLMNNTSVCNANGVCTAVNTCLCNSDYSGSRCDLISRNCVSGFYGYTCESRKQCRFVLTSSVKHV
jgi:hypothetical protein